MLIRPFLCLVLAVFTLQAQSQSASLLSPREADTTHVSKVWIASTVALLAATSLDAASSWGKYEGNPLLRSSNGTFGAQGVSLKFAIAGAMLAPQLLFRKNRRATKFFTITNFAQAGMFTGIAVHNFGIPQPAQPGPPPVK
ncbi:MAG TPA: hypothetical protein VN633_24785 [Bryobacteraceae bacterium]|nr:hypothetical protein [Bryobacteraceae bacterium]